VVMHPIIALPVSTIALGERVLSSNPTEVAKAPWESLRLFNLLSRSGHTHRFPNRSGIAPRVIMLSLDKSVNHKNGSPRIWRHPLLGVAERLQTFWGDETKKDQRPDLWAVLTRR